MLPAALDAPAALIGEGGMRDDGVASTLTRAPDHDELVLVRPHVGRGEEVLWAVRVAAKAFETVLEADPHSIDALRGLAALAVEREDVEKALDRLLANLGYGSRREVGHMVAGGLVTLDGRRLRDPGERVDDSVKRTVGRLNGAAA